MLKSNTSDSYEGAAYVAADPIESEECCRESTIQEMAVAAAAAGLPYVVKGGRLFLDASAAELEDLCSGPEPDPTGNFPDPLVDGELNSVTGTGFGATEGEVWLTNTANFAGSGTKVEQTVVIWGDAEVQFTGVLGGLPQDPQPVWLWVFNACARRNGMGFQTSIEAGA